MQPEDQLDQLLDEGVEDKPSSRLHELTMEDLILQNQDLEAKLRTAEEALNEAHVVAEEKLMEKDIEILEAKTELARVELKLRHELEPKTRRISELEEVISELTAWGAELETNLELATAESQQKDSEIAELSNSLAATLDCFKNNRLMLETAQKNNQINEQLVDMFGQVRAKLLEENAELKGATNELQDELTNVMSEFAVHKRNADEQAEQLEQEKMRLEKRLAEMEPQLMSTAASVSKLEQVDGVVPAGLFHLGRELLNLQCLAPEPNQQELLKSENGLYLSSVAEIFNICWHLGIYVRNSLCKVWHAKGVANVKSLHSDRPLVIWMWGLIRNVSGFLTALSHLLTLMSSVEEYVSLETVIPYNSVYEVNAFFWEVVLKVLRTKYNPGDQYEPLQKATRLINEYLESKVSIDSVQEPGHLVVAQWMTLRVSIDIFFYATEDSDRVQLDSGRYLWGILDTLSTFLPEERFGTKQCPTVAKLEVQPENAEGRDVLILLTRSLDKTSVWNMTNHFSQVVLAFEKAANLYQVDDSVGLIPLAVDPFPMVPNLFRYMEEHLRGAVPDMENLTYVLFVKRYSVQPVIAPSPSLLHHATTLVQPAASTIGPVSRKGSLSVSDIETMRGRIAVLESQLALFNLAKADAENFEAARGEMTEKLTALSEQKVDVERRLKQMAAERMHLTSENTKLVEQLNERDKQQHARFLIPPSIAALELLRVQSANRALCRELTETSLQQADEYWRQINYVDDSQAPFTPFRFKGSPHYERLRMCLRAREELIGKLTGKAKLSDDCRVASQQLLEHRNSLRKDAVDILNRWKAKDFKFKQPLHEPTQKVSDQLELIAVAAGTGASGKIVVPDGRRAIEQTFRLCVT